MEDMIECLGHLNFSRLEAQIYLTLLEKGKQSGYQIAKNIHISRPSVYAALDHMFEKGVVLLLSEDVHLYEAQKPDILFHRLRQDFSEHAEQAASGLRDLYESRREERFTNIKGLESVVAYARDLLQSARREVYLNTDFDLHLFEEEFAQLHRRGVRVVVFTFAALDHTGMDIEYYTHNIPPHAHADGRPHAPSRIMLVSDVDATLVADVSPAGDWFGTVTNNRLMVSIISEHIHHDIYLLRLRQFFGPDTWDRQMREHIRLNTLLENR